MSHLADLWYNLYAYLAANNGDPIDTKILGANGLIGLAYMTSSGTSGWVAATNAVHTVAASKTLYILEARACGAVGDTANRQADLYNTTDSAEIHNFTNAWGSASFIYQGDVTTGAFPTVAATKTVKVRVWENSSTRRSVGAIYICWER